jgi:glycine hydroxymethyltransferase
MLIDTVSSVGVSGKEASLALEKANITLNKNAIPKDPRKPWDPSGVRIGTPAITTRGMKEKEMGMVAEYIDKVLRNIEDEKLISKISSQVKNFTKDFPIPGIS